MSLNSATTRAGLRPAPPSPPRFPVLPRPRLDWTPEVEAATAHLYERVARVMPPIEWPFHAPYVKAINELKKERGAVILAHNYRRRRSTIASPIMWATACSSPSSRRRRTPR